MTFKKTFFPKLLETYRFYQKQRSQIVPRSSDLLRNSKQAIFAIHRGDKKEMAEAIKIIDDLATDLIKVTGEKDYLKYEGSFLAALEEYIEAKLFYAVLSGKPIDFLPKIKEEYYEEYLGGVCDVTGELVRQATREASKGNYRVVAKYRDITESFVGELIKFNLVSHLRQKYDEARRNLERLERMIYELKIRDLK